MIVANLDTKGAIPVSKVRIRKLESPELQNPIGLRFSLIRAQKEALKY